MNLRAQVAFSVHLFLTKALQFSLCHAAYKFSTGLRFISVQAVREALKEP